jgi:hypothetical protein
LLKVKSIFDESFKVLVRVASLWYNKIAEKQEDIKKALDEMFSEELEEEEFVKEEKTEEAVEAQEDEQEGSSQEG